MRSIFGEWSGNVRSTPTPNDCFRTVNVSRTPAPWRLMTMPSKTCTRDREPSMTRKWTRTLSPALNLGRPLRSWRCSMVPMAFITKEGPAPGRPTMLAKLARRPGCQSALAEPDPVRRPVDEEHRADQVPPRHRAPLARVAGLRPVVPHEEVVALRDPPVSRPVVAPVLLDVGLLERRPVDGH